MTDATGKRLALVTNSEANCQQECQKKRQFRYVELRRPLVDAKALTLGTVFHAGMEADATGVDRWLAADDPHEQAMLDAMLLMHKERYDKLEYLHVEHEMQGALINPETGAASRTYRYGGKVDGIVKLMQEKWVIDHKTTSFDVSPGSDHLEQARMAPQGYRYVALARANGIEVAGFIMNLVRKPTIKPLKATPLEKRRVNKDGSFHAKTRFEDETPQAYRKRCVERMSLDPDSYLARVTVRVTDEDVREAQADLWQIVKSMMDSDRLGIYPRNSLSCFKWGRPCEYWPVCTGQAGLDDPMLFRTATKSHEELAS